MKFHIERYLPGFGWVAEHDTTELKYFNDVKQLRDIYPGSFRLVRTVTVKARTVVTSDCMEVDKG